MMVGEGQVGTMTSNDIAGRWLRVSTGGQDEANQEPQVDGWISDHGYEVGPTYRLHGQSASKGKQDKMLARVVEDMQAGRITVLVVWYSARIERRGAYNAFDLARRVREAHGRIEYVMEPWLNETNTMSDVMLALAAGQNKQYSETLSQNVRIAHKRIDANGAVRGRVIYGYSIVGKKYSKRLEVVESEAELIRDAADWYLAGDSLAMVCRKLNNAGRFTRPKLNDAGEVLRPGAKWSPKTLGQVLRSETIIGRHHQGTSVVKVPSILTVKQWRAVQTKLDAKAYRKGTRTRPDTAFLTSLLYCEHGHPLYRTGAYYYERNGCRPGLMVPLKVVDEIVFTGIMNMGDDPSAEQITREILIPGHNYQDDIDQLALSMRDLDPLADDYVGQVTTLRAEVDHLRTLPNEPDRVEVMAVSWSEFRAEWKKNMTTAERREFLISLGMRFIARKDGGEVIIRPTRMPATVQNERSS
jgi:DNA invertase Pin-like site-specific DNA recombinase